MIEDSHLALLAPLDRRNSLGELAYESLKDTIIRGQFAPGAKLTVRSVAQALGVSTTPARDAINRLIGEGALANLGPKTVVVPTLTMASLDEVTKIRLALEGLAAQESVGAATPEDLEFLERTQAQINKALDESRYAEVLALNKDFHFRIYTRARMPRLIAIIESQWLRIGPLFNVLYPEFQVTRQGVYNHQWAMRGLKDRDGATVRAAIENDIRDGYRRLSQVVLQVKQEA